MEDNAGTISVNGSVKAQVQLTTMENGQKKAQLYSANGVYLCEAEYTGDSKTGFEIGEALCKGYMAGCANTQFSIARRVSSAAYATNDPLLIV